MSWTVGDVIQQSREVIQDTRSASYRHPDSKLLGYFNHAMSETWRLRPDLFIGDNEPGLLTAARDPQLTDNLADPFPLEEQYFSPFVMFVAGMVGLGDDEYANDGRAAALLSMFRMQLTGERSAR